MLVDPIDWTLAHQVDNLLPALSPELAKWATAETHGATLELRTDVHTTVAPAVAKLASLRRSLEAELDRTGLRAASAGTHPFTVWNETVISSGKRYQFVYGSMRELARREPTFALHVHVGVADPENAIRVANRLRGHLPMLLALSANSPFWQGRDTGLASARTPLFSAFPRVGVPRAFADYADYAATVDRLVRCEAIPESTFLWWDVRPQPRFGTVEVRVMDAQTTVDETAALVALVQSIAKLEIEQGWVSPLLLDQPEVLEENRFIAARDGVDARLIDPESERRVPLRQELDRLLEACEPHAAALGCLDQLRWIEQLADRNGAQRQIAVAREGGRLVGLVGALAGAFTAVEPAGAMARLHVATRY